MKRGIELTLSNGKVAKIICFTRNEFDNYMRIIKEHHKGQAYKFINFSDYDEVENWLLDK